MKSQTFSVLLVLIASVVGASALATPGYRIRRQDGVVSGNGTGTDQDSICAGSTPTLLSTTPFVVSGNTLLLSNFACDGAPPTVPATSGKGISPMAADLDLGDILGWLDGLLWWLFPPCPPVQPNPPKETTTTKTTTKTTTHTTTHTTTETKTSTKTSTATKASTTTVTSVSVSATTATETETATTTETDTETQTATTTATVTAPSATPSGTDVCNEICTVVCGEVGQLPPTSEDCQTLVDSITILNGQIPPTFTVDSNHVQTIEFGTCRFFFENISNGPLTYCWTSLVQTASVAETQCLPPNSPVLSEGLCIPSDGTWEVGVAHS